MSSVRDMLLKYSKVVNFDDNVDDEERGGVGERRTMNGRLSIPHIEFLCLEGLKHVSSRILFHTFFWSQEGIGLKKFF